MCKRMRLAAARPRHASGNQPTGYKSNWEKARGTSSARPLQTKQARGKKIPPVSSKKVMSTHEWRRRKDGKCEADGDARKGAVTASLMDAELKAFAARVALSPQERQLRTKTFQDLRDLISSAFQDATIQLYGSSSSRLETFRSDMDVTVGNIALSSSQLLPSVVLCKELAEEQHNPETEGGKNCAIDKVHTNEEAISFSLNLALPVGVVASKDNANITRRVQPTQVSHWNPTLRRRKLCVLRALQVLLKSKRPHFQVKCLHKAKVPILMVLDTKTKLSIDIGVNRDLFETSEHGRSTALVQRFQNTYGAPFTTIVLFLKEFLHQFELDKPFTGGLGSFRLYMMVAYVFQRNASKRKNKDRSVSSHLLAFFMLFGNKNRPNFLHEGTQLPLSLGDGGHLDFGGVYRIDDCVETFAMAHDILSSTGKIGSIIYEERLERDRR